MIVGNVASFTDVSQQLSHVVDVITSHPFWIFDTQRIFGDEVLLCAPILFLGGLLCSAGGIGGGGVYVTLLMVVGRLAPHDAVPLSKAIVFLGSLSSLVLNLRKSAVLQSGVATKCLIDYSICRIVVPASLLGTLLGVLLNRIAADWVIVGALCAVLGGMTVAVIRTFFTQRAAEDLEDAANAAPEDSVHLPLADGAPGYGGSQALTLSVPNKRSLGVYGRQDALAGLGLLLTVVLCGVLRAHASACADQMHLAGAHQACHHPINTLFYRNTLEGFMIRPALAQAIQHFFLVVPICMCLGVMIHCSRLCIAKEGWNVREVALYQCMGVSTGCLAGLVGIGGGLIFSPFFLVLGVEPAVAVATSSTCVIFTSSSTTMQYLLTDRIITSLAATYGIVNLLASWAGTSFVHFLQDNFNTRKSYITAIVAVGVILSTVLSFVKLLQHSSSGGAVHIH